MSKLYEFMRSRYDAFPIMLGTSRVRPGMIIDTDWRPTWPWEVDTRPDFEREEMFAWDALEESKYDYKSDFVEANLLYGTVTNRYSIGGEVSLPQFGLTLSAELEHEYKAEFRITDLRARVFQNSSHGFVLMSKLNALRQPRPDLWRVINDDFLVTETYHVASLHAAFSSRGTGKAKADFEEAGVRLAAGLDLEWKSDESFELAGLSKVPLAVRGVKI